MYRWPRTLVSDRQAHAGLLRLKNVCLVPHLGSATRETRVAMADRAVRTVLAVLAGRPVVTPVTR